MPGPVSQALILAASLFHPGLGLNKQDPNANSADQALLQAGTGGTFDRASSELLCSLGMPSACDAAEQFQNESHDALLQMPQAKECLPEGQLIFHHVMKTGGVSVRNYLECHCRKENCGIWRDDGHRDLDPYLDPHCPPTICTTHADYPEVLEEGRCGEEFKQAKSFTMLRDPVERVWSFYNYVRRYYKPFQERTLSSILLGLGHEDLNDGLKVDDACKYCADQLSNHMVRAQFCGLGKEECEAMKHALPDSKKLHAAQIAAHEVLGNMSAIFYFDDFEGFPAKVEAAHLLPVPESSGGFWPMVLEGHHTIETCDVTQYNPTNYTADGTHAAQERPDPVTMNLIKHVNKADIKLYRHSRSLPGAIIVAGRKPPVHQLTGRGQPQAIIRKHGDTERRWWRHAARRHMKRRDRSQRLRRQRFQ